MTESDELCWSDDSIPFLNSQNVLDYFCQASNPFYDKTCLNEVYKMDKRNTKLNFTKGIYYELNPTLSKEPYLFIIEKKDGRLQQKFQVQNTFYVLGNKVFQSPTIFDSLRVKLNNMLFLFNLSFKEQRNNNESTSLNVLDQNIQYPIEIQSNFNILLNELEKETSKDLLK